MAIENVGYRPKDNLIRWAAVEREVRRDQIANPTCLELGSNFGFMSASFAEAVPASRVFSIEGSFGTGNEGGTTRLPADQIGLSQGIKKHQDVLEAHGLKNNYICLGLADSAMINRLLQAGIFFDYQICFSVFHWILDVSDSKDHQKILVDCLQLARTTFIELPDMRQPDSHPLPRIYQDYATIPQAINEACMKNRVDVRITYLCSCPWYGTRDTYRIDNLSRGPNTRNATTDEIISAIGFPTA